MRVRPREDAHRRIGRREARVRAGQLRRHRNGAREVCLPALPRRRRGSAGAAAGGREIAGRRRAARARRRLEVCRSPAAASPGRHLRAAGRRPLAHARCVTGSRTSRRRSTPIGEQLRREVTAATYLQTDDTAVTVLDERGGSYKGRLWTYLDPLGPPGRLRRDARRMSATGPETFLADFRGRAAGRCLHRLRRAVSDRPRRGDRLLGARAARASSRR